MADLGLDIHVKEKKPNETNKKPTQNKKPHTKQNKTKNQTNKQQKKKTTPHTKKNPGELCLHAEKH